jgi:hypothetical protein
LAVSTNTFIKSPQEIIYPWVRILKAALCQASTRIKTRSLTGENENSRPGRITQNLTGSLNKT